VKPLQSKAEGDCLFISFELQFYGEVRGGNILRQREVEYIAACGKHSDFFKNYIEQEGSSVDEYLKGIATGAWGDTVDIYALAELFQQRVKVYDPEANLLATYGEVWAGIRPDIGLLFWNAKNHYDVVVPLTWHTVRHSTAPAPGIYEDSRIKKALADGPSKEVLEFREEILSKDILLGDVAEDALREGTADEPASVSEQEDYEPTQAFDSEEQEASYSHEPLSKSYLSSSAIEKKVLKREMEINFTNNKKAGGTLFVTDQERVAARKELVMDYQECLDIVHGLTCRNQQLEDTLKTVLDETDKAQEEREKREQGRDCSTQTDSKQDEPKGGKTTSAFKQPQSSNLAQHRTGAQAAQPKKEKL
jgi:hypothetical protein